MKKNTISVDIVAFGEPDEATEKKLKEFHNNVNSSEGCFFGVIPPGPNLLSDTLLSTDLLAQDGVGQSGGAGGSGGDGGASGENAFEFGVNPEVDPELALALRMSYEEEKARQEKARQEQEDADKRAGNKLEDIAEADEKQPLLSEEKKDEKKKKDDEDDKMDTA
jgi:26S proteasome regulatory subunit N10